jgi:hypothetical protein
MGGYKYDVTDTCVYVSMILSVGIVYCRTVGEEAEIKKPPLAYEYIE